MDRQTAETMVDALLAHALRMGREMRQRRIDEGLPVGPEITPEGIQLHREKLLATVLGIDIDTGGCSS